ncbi:MAG: DUF948 domain-containing protein [Bacillus sp. (in: firmicutes)]
MEWIVYVSVALVTVSFCLLVYHTVQTLKRTEKTLNRISSTLIAIKKETQGVTLELTMLLKKTNALADDFRRKSLDLQTATAAVKDIRLTVQEFQTVIREISESVKTYSLESQEKISRLFQLGQIIQEAKNAWRRRNT